MVIGIEQNRKINCRRFHFPIKTITVIILLIIYHVIVYKQYHKYTDYQIEPFPNLNLNLGHWDNQHKYKMFDNFIVGEKYITLNYQYKTCLATQGSLDRLPSLIEVAKYWNGPISFATFAENEDKLKALLLYILYIIKCHEEVKEKVSFHLALVKGLELELDLRLEKLNDLTCDNSTKALELLSRNLQNQTNWQQAKLLYPQNHLRNLARKNCQSDHVFLVDIDVIPSKAMAEDLNVFLSEEKCDGKCAYVVPTFELSYKAKFPHNKSVLLELVRKGLARPFHAEVFSFNQKATNFNRWQYTIDKTNEVHVSHQADKKLFSFYYEPFYIASDTVPPHDERFIGYGYTRNTQVHEMVASGYKFLVLSPLFACHWGFQKKNSRPRWRQYQLISNEVYFKKFIKEVSVKYKENPGKSKIKKPLAHKTRSRVANRV